MSGPIPAGSPSVSASGRVMSYRISIIAWLRSSFRNFFDAPDIAPGTSRRAPRAWPACRRLSPSSCRRRRTSRRPAASRPGGVSRPTGVLLSTSRCCCAEIGGLARDRFAHRDVRQAPSRSAGLRRSSGSARARLRPRACALRATVGAAPRGTRNRTGRSVYSKPAGSCVCLAALQLHCDFLLADLQAALEFAADDLRPDEVGMDARLQRFRADTLLAVSILVNCAGVIPARRAMFGERGFDLALGNLGDVALGRAGPSACRRSARRALPGAAASSAWRAESAACAARYRRAVIGSPLTSATICACAPGWRDEQHRPRAAEPPTRPRSDAIALAATDAAIRVAIKGIISLFLAAPPSCRDVSVQNSPSRPTAVWIRD